MSRRASPPVFALALALAATACGSDSAEDSSASNAVTETPTFELRDVVEAQLANLVDPPAPPPLDDDLLAEARGLCSLAASDAAMLAVAREDVARMPAGVTQALQDAALDRDLPDRERAAAIDLIDVDSDLGAQALADLAASATQNTDGWMRARAAWRLSDAGPDYLVPALLRPLKYDKHHETVVWLARALAWRANYAGLDGLIAIAGMPESDAQASAQAAIAAILADVGLDSVEELWRAWNSGDPDGVLPHPERSERYTQEIWRCIGRFREFALRGVDDSRFILQRMDEPAARILAVALHERDVYTRVHVAQCLQRMGPRGAVGGPGLLTALDEAEVAPHAAIALGHIQFVEALNPLRDRLAEETPLAVRLAATRALGHLGQPAALSDLRALLDAEPAELAQAAAESVAMLDSEDTGVCERLLAWIADPRVEPTSSERAVRGWLYERGADDVIAEWDKLATPTAVVETREEARARRSERVALVREYLAR